MTPQDPRHGSRRGYYAHRKAGQSACDQCKRAAAAAEARYAMLRARGLQSRLPAVGVQRRLRALYALGWTWTALDREMGTFNMADKWARQNYAYVFPATQKTIVDLFERLSMTLPPERTPAERRAAARARNAARKQGWPPPLAWDDIDNDPEPQGVGYVSPNRAEALRDLAAMGVGLIEACRRLEVGWEALERWCTRHQMYPVYVELVRQDRRAA